KTNRKLSLIKQIQDEKLIYLNKILNQYDSTEDLIRDSLRNKRKSLFVSGMSPEQMANVQSGKEFKKIDSLLAERLLNFQEQETEEVQKELDEQIQQIASEFQLARIGWTWEIAGGTSAEFRNRRFDNSKLYNAGFWTTIGYTDTVYGAGLLLLRLLHSPDKIFAKDNMANDIGDITTFDAGLRYIYSKTQSKFSISLEA